MAFRQDVLMETTMIQLKITCNTGATWVTSFNGDFSEAENYFLNNVFTDEDDDGHETHHKCVAIKLAVPSLHSKEWFDDAFYFKDNKPFAITNQLRDLCESICKSYGIRGICDPGYIANVIAQMFNVGDGIGTFKNEIIKGDSSDVERAYSRIMSSYSSSINDGGILLKSIIYESIQRPFEIKKTSLI